MDKDALTGNRGVADSRLKKRVVLRPLLVSFFCPEEQRTARAKKALKSFRICPCHIKRIRKQGGDLWLSDRRMISKRIVESSRFLKLSDSAQKLYLHLMANTDDDGIYLDLLRQKRPDVRILEKKTRTGKKKRRILQFPKHCLGFFDCEFRKQRLGKSLKK